jgi:hypothetical protein
MRLASKGSPDEKESERERASTEGSSGETNGSQRRFAGIPVTHCCSHSTGPESFCSQKKRAFGGGQRLTAPHEPHVLDAPSPEAPHLGQSFPCILLLLLLDVGVLLCFVPEAFLVVVSRARLESESEIERWWQTGEGDARGGKAGFLVNLESDRTGGAH